MVSNHNLMLTLRISSEELKEVNYERYHYPCPKIRIRFFVVSLLAAHKSISEVAGLAGVHPNTVRTCIRLFNKEGIAGLRQLHYKKPATSFSSFESTIEQSLRRDPVRSSREAAARIEQLSGVSISPERARVFMRRIGMKCLRMGHIPAKADTVKQQDFLTTTLEPLIEAAKKGKSELFFLDGAHFILEPFICMVWCFVRLFVKGASGRNRINVLGAINAITHQLETVINTTYITATEVVELLGQIRAKYKGRVVHVVLDNVRYQHCDLVKAAACKLRINLVYLPSYSPNLNIIERLWKFIRKKVLHGKYYEVADTFHSAIRSAVQKVNHDTTWKTELQSLLNLKFQLF